MSKPRTGHTASPVFKRIGLIGRPGGGQVVESLRAVVQSLQGLQAPVLLEDRTAALVADQPGAVVSRAELGAQCDLIVVVGGDGSLLGVARDLAHARVPVVGVNRGSLGFLADIAPKRIAEQLQAVLRGAYRVEDHFLLEAAVLRGDEEIARSRALNDVVVHPGGVARMMEFSLAVNGSFVYDQRSDGLIVSSPTGSTAYALSAGGPIMHPSLDAIVIVPMFPHTLTSRPLVVRGDATLTVTLGPVRGAQVSCDSQVIFDLEAGDRIWIEKYAHPLRLVHTEGSDFYQACRSKLDWASRLGGRE